MRWTVLYVLFIVIKCIYSNERGQSCVTPNNETATCVPIKQCSLILDLIKTRNSTAIEFARKSQCGYDTEPLVCCGTSVVLPSGPTSPANAEDVLPDINVCGFDNTDRLIGGNKTQMTEYPWLAALEYEEKENNQNAGIRCGGSVLNSKYVLTAAHCIRTAKYNLVRVWLGDWVLSTDPDCEHFVANDIYCTDPVKKLNIEEQIPHPDYDPVSNQNDIGLLRLQNSIQYSDFIQPLCFPTADLSSLQGRLAISGWGATQNGAKFDTKMKATVTASSTNDCEKKIVPTKTLSINQQCASSGAVKSSCWGDSGGPIFQMYFNANTGGVRWFHEGVISWTADCDYVIYTRVANYTEWIVDIIVKAEGIH